MIVRPTTRDRQRRDRRETGTDIVRDPGPGFHDCLWSPRTRGRPRSRRDDEAIPGGRTGKQWRLGSRRFSCRRRTGEDLHPKEGGSRGKNASRGARSVRKTRTVRRGSRKMAKLEGIVSGGMTTVEESYAHAERLTRAQKTTFYHTFRFLTPPRKSRRRRFNRTNVFWCRAALSYSNAASLARGAI